MPHDDEVWDMSDFEEKEEDTSPDVFSKPSPADVTDKYNTLPGYAVTQEIRDGERAIGREEVYTAYRLMQIQAGIAPFIASDLADTFRDWVKHNYGLIRVAMGYGENSGRPPNEEV